MTTTVVTQLAALLGDDVDHSRYVWRDGEPAAKYPLTWKCCDRSRKADK